MNGIYRQLCNEVKIFTSLNAIYHFQHFDKQVSYNLRFIDSYAFLVNALNALVNSIPI